MTTQIPFSITFTPRGGSAIELAPEGGWLSALPAFAGEQRVFEAGGVSLGEEFFRALGGAVITFELALEKMEADAAAARNVHLDATMPMHGVLTFAADGWEASMDAAMHSLDTELPGGTGEATSVRVYRVTAGANVHLTIEEAEE